MLLDNEEMYIPVSDHHICLIIIWFTKTGYSIGSITDVMVPSIKRAQRGDTHPNLSESLYGIIRSG